MAHPDPDDRRRATDGIDRGDASLGWAPLVLVIAFLVLVGLLIVGSKWAPQSDRVSDSQRSEMPNTAPNAPPVRTPAPPVPQYA
jgi:hypothetical protein